MVSIENGRRKSCEDISAKESLSGRNTRYEIESFHSSSSKFESLARQHYNMVDSLVAQTKSSNQTIPKVFTDILMI